MAGKKAPLEKTALQTENMALQQRVKELEEALSETEQALQKLQQWQEATLVEEALHDSEERYRRLVETSPDAICLFDLEGTILLANQSAAECVGCARTEDLLGMNVYDFVVPEDRERAQDNINLVLGDITPQRRSIRYQLVRVSDGMRVPIEVNASAIRDAAGTPRSIISVIRNISERVKHEYEREVLITIAAALRQATTRARMIPILLNEVSGIFEAVGSELLMCDLDHGGVVVELGVGALEGMTGARIEPGEGISGRVVATSQPYLTNDAPNDPLVVWPETLGPTRSIACVPLIAQEQLIGALCVGCTRTMTDNDVRVLSAVGDMAANALHRVTLHEQTERHLQQFHALRTIDLAMTTGLDLNQILNILLDQVIIHLHADATDILLFNSVTLELEYAVGRGVLAPDFSRTRIRLGEGCAGRVALKRTFACISDITQSNMTRARAALLQEEQFQAYYGMPLISGGHIKGVLEIFCRHPIPTNKEWVGFFSTLAGQAAIAIEHAELLANLQSTNDELILAYDTTIEGWAQALEMRDAETQGHSQRVTDMTLKLARAMGFDGEDLVHIRRGAVLHDVGKMSIPDSILLKQGPLTDAERAIMRQHPIYAFQWLSMIPFLRTALDIPYCHHERWDGTGYPRGLKGEEIPLVARIFAVVDVWDALRSNRPYRTGWPEERVLAHIQDEAGTHFDPHVVEIFLRVAREQPKE
jgi:PAS domain S-box-containing protein